MVGIVLVSHSRELSAAVKALAEQQIQGRARLAAVGGSDNPHQPYGTDPVAIAEAIQSVFTEEGVLVLMDLGSAVISGRVALDLLEPAQATRVHLSVGPFVEGALAAAVQASIGMDLAAVAREAEEAMQAKRSVLLHEVEEPAPAVHPADSASGAENHAAADVIVVNPAGLHFGPAARFIQAAARFRARITVINLTTDGGPADASRFNRLLSLGVEKNHHIRIAAVGSDAAEATRRARQPRGARPGRRRRKGDLCRRPGRDRPSPAAAASCCMVCRHRPAWPRARPLCSLLPRTRSRHLGASPPARSTRTASGPISWRRRHRLHQVHDLARQVHDTLGEEQSLIFQAQALLLGDEDLHAAVRRHIYQRALPCAEALRQTTLYLGAALPRHEWRSLPTAGRRRRGRGAPPPPHPDPRKRTPSRPARGCDRGGP